MNVLIVDDNSADVRLLTLWLGRSRAVRSVQSASSGREGLAAARSTAGFPDLVILDANLPDCSGWDVLTELRQDPGLDRCPVMMLSGSSTPEDEQRACELGAIGFHLKPFDADDFEALVERIEAFADERFRH